MKYITIGIAGHVDHGKTSLVRCLTGIDTDRMKEEKIRRVSIETGIAPLKLKNDNDLHLAFVDIPGHIDFMKNAIRGLVSVDMVILVIAANDSVMPQTREHLQLLHFFNIACGFIVLSKVDLVDKETVELAKLEINEMLTGTFFENKPIISFSSTEPDNAENIHHTIKSEAGRILLKEKKAPFRLWIDQIKSMTGYGTVVSGTIFSGVIHKDDPIQLMPSGLYTRARFLESHGNRIDQAVAGQRVGINLHKIHISEVNRGMSILLSDMIHGTFLINAEFKIMNPIKKAVKNRQRVKLFLGTSITSVVVIILEKHNLEFGQTGLVQFRLLKLTASDPGDLFVVSLLNNHTIIGGGKVLEIPEEKFRKSKAITSFLT